MASPSSAYPEAAVGAWSAMRAFVAAHDRRRELQEALGLGRGLGRVKVLVLLTDGPMTLRDIAEATGVDAPYATVVVDKLVSRGLVERTAHPEDNRRKLVKLTASGRDAAALAGQILAEPPAALLALAPGDLALLEDVLTWLAAATANAQLLTVTDGLTRIHAPVLADRPVRDISRLNDELKGPAGRHAHTREEGSMVTSMSEPSPRRHRYGSDPSQFADLHLPARRRRPGTVALLHGGWWGPRFGAGNLDAVAADLAGRGWVAWNIEYRRLGLGGGYPATLQDAAAAIDHLATLAGVDTKRVVAVGHSAGGHLAAWAAGRTKLPAGAPGAEPVIQIAGVISLAGVLDLGAAAREKIGNGAAIELMGGDPDELPERYAVADPLSQVPIPAAVRCVHAQADDRVPFAQSVTYVAAARAAGQDARLLEADADHFSVADTSAPTWPVVINALEELSGAA